MNNVTKLKDAILNQNTEQVLKLVFNDTFTKMQMNEIFNTIVIPFIKEVDQLEDNSSKIWQEHHRSEMLMMLLNGLKTRMVVNDSKEPTDRPRSLLLSPEGEHHELPLKMIELYLILEGWQVFYTGPNVPLSQIASLVLEQKPEAVIISVTNFYNLLTTKKTIEIIQKTEPTLKVFVGGQAVEKNPTYFDSELVVLSLENLLEKMGVTEWDSH